MIYVVAILAGLTMGHIACFFHLAWEVKKLRMRVRALEDLQIKIDDRRLQESWDSEEAH